MITHFTCNGPIERVLLISSASKRILEHQQRYQTCLGLPKIELHFGESFLDIF